MKPLYSLLIVAASTTALGLFIGVPSGYLKGLNDHRDSLLQSIDSLRAAYQNAVDDLTTPYDTIKVTETTYYLIRKDSADLNKTYVKRHFDYL